MGIPTLEGLFFFYKIKRKTYVSIVNTVSLLRFFSQKNLFKNLFKSTIFVTDKNSEHIRTPLSPYDRKNSRKINRGEKCVISKRHVS